MPLENCCKILDNKRKPISRANREEGKYPYYGANGIQDYVSNYIFDGKYVLVGEDGSVITENGNPVINWATGKIWVNNHAHIIEEIPIVNLRYLYYYLHTIDISNLVHGNIPKLTGTDFKNLLIPIPNKNKQEEIVNILDKFEEYINSIESGLKGEIKARHQQYKYYRNKLLTFDRKEV